MKLVLPKLHIAMSLKAYRSAPATLESRPLASLCQNFVKGGCKKERCDYDGHRLCRINEVEAAVPATQAASTNVLRPEARKADNFNDADGPGRFAEAGPRHDNDHTDITRIKVLPTTDEVSQPLTE